MKKQSEKPSPEAKALSLFLMAYKTKDPFYKEESKRINKLWDLVKDGDLTKPQYDKEVVKMLDTYGGYAEVLQKTVKFYIDKTGEWKLKGDDKYCMDAQKVAEKILKIK